MDRHRFEQFVAGRFPPDRAAPNAPLAPLTTFKVGGPADWLIDVRSVAELSDLLAAARNADVPVTMLGGGSNVLIGDRGVRGAVVRLRLSSVSQPAPGCVRAEAGVTINGLVRWTVMRGLMSIEAWAGTPGTVGGATYGNAHYGGRNIGDRMSRVQLITRDGASAIVSRDEMEFGYDTSRLQRTHEIVIWAEFAVSTDSPDRLRQTARASLAHRKRTQPLETPSAGCIFQNPDPATDPVPEGVPASAGALVDLAGLKGHRSGGAHISPTHANFFVNDGHATAREVRDLMETARRAVKARFGIVLRDEIVCVGEF